MQAINKRISIGINDQFIDLYLSKRLASLTSKAKLFWIEVLIQ